jgi:hypothetical protein
MWVALRQTQPSHVAGAGECVLRCGVFKPLSKGFCHHALQLVFPSSMFPVPHTRGVAAGGVASTTWHPASSMACMLSAAVNPSIGTGLTCKPSSTVLCLSQCSNYQQLSSGSV